MHPVVDQGLDRLIDRREVLHALLEGDPPTTAHLLSNADHSFRNPLRQPHRTQIREIALFAMEDVRSDVEAEENIMVTEY